MAGIDFAKQRIGHTYGGIKIEAGEWTADISNTTAIPSTMTKLIGALAWVDYSAGGGQMISGVSLCAGPYIDVSIAGGYVEYGNNTKITYVAFGW